MPLVWVFLCKVLMHETGQLLHISAPYHTVAFVIIYSRLTVNRQSLVGFVLVLESLSSACCLLAPNCLKA